MKLVFLLGSILFASQLYGQHTITLHGMVLDLQNNEPIELVSVFANEFSTETTTSQAGKYEFVLPAGKTSIIQFRRTGYKPADYKLPVLIEGTRYELNINLAPVESNLEVIITSERVDDAGMVRENVEAFKLLPSTTGNLESILPHIALGTSSGTGGELTSQYNVRGGNYDENLVYVNDFEIYRPLLVRSGNQEGLSLPNIDLIRDLSFSSGSFEAKYGDKMSSVLDVRYKLPDSLRASFSASLLGATGHIEGSMRIGKDPYKRWRYLVGVRYKTSKYLLGSLDVDGEYSPSFADYQLYSTYDLSKAWQIGVLANLNKNRYDFIPVSAETATGLISFALKLSTDFEGAESDLFVNGMTGISLSFVPDRERNPLFLKLLMSGYKSLELENLDIIGQYRLSQIETSINNPDAGEELVLLGSGIQQSYSRNRLQTNILNAEIKGGIELQGPHNKSNFIQAGLKVGYEDVTDRIHEWERLDSAGYSLPLDPEVLDLQYSLNSNRDLQSLRYSGYVQNTFTKQYSTEKEIRITGGIRGQYWDVNQEFLLSPRFQLTWIPGAERGFKIATGWYMQPGFYKELRRPDGTINTDLKAQKSFQILAGYSAGFGPKARNGLKYKFILEAYYKSLRDLVSYEVDNVRIRYVGENNSSGYLAGVDMRINGELVPGAESWINLSFLRAREKFDGIQHLKRDIGEAEGSPVADVPRPTDQFMTLNVFFQDYLPNNENFRVHLSTSIGTGLPFGIKDNNTIYRNTYRYKPYHRVDIGFSTRLWTRAWKKDKPHNFLAITRDSWVSLEIFNLLQVRNEASRTWIKTIFKSQYAIPNYLSSRRLNLKLRCEF
ncbi:MAG TPA: carboxypeptidase-like regulatory domain-containing protein [Saprospiraceae bacterium]|nr:carboxypeptidase-like regulatory domain-containing protein [Saprospiraceae bacterium]